MRLSSVGSIIVLLYESLTEDDLSIGISSPCERLHTADCDIAFFCECSEWKRGVDVRRDHASERNPCGICIDYRVPSVVYVNVVSEIFRGREGK